MDAQALALLRDMEAPSRREHALGWLRDHSEEVLDVLLRASRLQGSCTMGLRYWATHAAFYVQASSTCRRAGKLSCAASAWRVVHVRAQEGTHVTAFAGDPVAWPQAHRAALGLQQVLEQQRALPPGAAEEDGALWIVSGEAGARSGGVAWQGGAGRPVRQARLPRVCMVQCRRRRTCR